MRFAVLILPLLVLSACGGGEPAQNTTAQPPIPKPTGMSMSGIDFTKPIRAVGTEPYWTLDLAPGDIEYMEFSTADPQPAPFFPVMPVIAGQTATYTTKTAKGEPVVLTLSLEDCLGTGQGENHEPLVAELKIGGQVLHGCAGPKPDFISDADNATENATDNAAVNATAP
jgi:uncharacterized membrane protein